MNDNNMIMKRPLGEKGQVVIPRDIRELLGLHSGENVVFEVKSDDVKIKSDKSPEEFLRDFLNVPGKKKKKSSIKEIKSIIMEQYDEEIP